MGLLSPAPFPAIAADAARLQSEGGLVGIGSHGEAPGIGFHWEMELHGAGGMTPLAVLHAATIGSAETIGRSSDLGSIEPGKIADLVVLSADPLADLRNARAVAWVMRDGHLYNARDLSEVWPNAKPLSPSWFVSGGTAQWLPANPDHLRVQPLLGEVAARRADGRGVPRSTVR